jgi:amino acid permease
MKEAPLKALVDEDDQPSTDPLLKRWFGPLSSGGFRGSLLTLCSSTIGVGFLTLPEIGKKSGAYTMVALILGSACISMFANWQISRGFRATGGKTYSKIVARVDGRLSSLVNMIFLFLYVYVSAGAYYLFGN